MKNLCIALLLLMSTHAVAQTHVSGGIYTNTIWSKANSPYIVDSLLVTFPGVKLTIEPGVKVRFKKNVLMEIRQGTLVARGTPNDSIWFTSDSNAPYDGVWTGIYLNNSILEPVAYIHMAYAAVGFDANTSTAVQTHAKRSTFFGNTIGIMSGINSVDSCVFNKNAFGIQNAALVTNCRFLKNHYGTKNCTGFVYDSYFENIGTGIYSFYGKLIKNCVFINNSGGISALPASGTRVENCTFKKNQYGLSSVVNATITNNTIDSNGVGIWMMGGNLIEKNSISYNGIGIDEAYGNPNTFIYNTIEFDSIGLDLLIPEDVIRCNKICNHKTYSLRYTSSNNTKLPFARENYWCSNDSSTIAASIFDGYDHVSSGLVSFTPLDANSCYLETGITQVHRASNCSVFPNPSKGKFTVKFFEPFGGVLTVRDIGGALVHQSNYSGEKEIELKLDVAPGVYLLDIRGENQFFQQKLLIEE